MSPTSHWTYYDLAAIKKAGLMVGVVYGAALVLNLILRRLRRLL